MNRVLCDGLSKLGLSELQAPLEKYIAEIELFNNAYGLVSVKDTTELIVKHILDSLSPLVILRENLPKLANLKIADAGSGAGLPGIPLAISLENVPGAKITLIERSGKRCGFLRNTCLVLKLSNVEIEESEIEQVPPPFDAVVFRALRPLTPQMLKSLFALLPPHGILAAWKGKLENIENEMQSVEKLIGGWDAHKVEVPFLEEERHLVVIKKPQL
jgi:16S rRNA (guanine527-N7)-methyltransferase